MERREPTLTGGANSEREEPILRRSSPAYDDSRAARSPAYAPAPASSSVPMFALIVGILGLGVAALVGWQLMQAQALIAKDAARIQQLENQLNLASSESTNSVTALGINLQKLDGDVKKLTETSRKSLSDHGDKLVSLSKGLESAKADIGALKGDTSSLKQESISHKVAIDELSPRVDSTEKNMAEQRKKVADVTATANALVSQVKSAEGLASRITKNEEAIDAIDDNRRTINRDLLQIKQQLGIKN